MYLCYFDSCTASGQLSQSHPLSFNEDPLCESKRNSLWYALYLWQLSVYYEISKHSCKYSDSEESVCEPEATSVICMATSSSASQVHDHHLMRCWHCIRCSFNLGYWLRKDSTWQSFKEENSEEDIILLDHFLVQHLHRKTSKIPARCIQLLRFHVGLWSLLVKESSLGWYIYDNEPWLVMMSIISVD